MGMIEEILRGITERAIKNSVARDAFESGQKGLPPKQWDSTELKEISNRAYEQGQKSVLVKIGNKIAKD